MAKKPLSTGFRSSGDMLTAHLLALLQGWSAYGYDLAQRLEEAGLGDYNKGSIYRALRQMERLGLVSSMWDTSADGPARRMYSMTKAGASFLNNWCTILEAHRKGLERLIRISAQAVAHAPLPPEDDASAVPAEPRATTNKV